MSGLAKLTAVATVVVQLAVAPARGATDDPYADLSQSWDRFAAVYGRVVQDYYTEVSPDTLMLGAIEGMLARLDAYSQYFDRQRLRQLREDTAGRFAGLGITVSRVEGYPVVVAPMAGTPAERAGLTTGDQIVAIEGLDTRSMPLDDVVDHLRGEPGTEVTITIRRPGVSAQARQVTVRRELVNVPSVALVDQFKPGIGYIGMRQTRFSEGTAAEVADALERLLADNVNALILDLRGNPGGLLAQATQVAELFLPRGAPIVSVRERNDRRAELRRSQRKPLAGELPLAVLIDGGSASAAEIVAGAIQDNDRGVIVGATSFGKGSVQTIFELHEGGNSALKLTTARYYTPSGRSIHRDAGDEAGSELLVLRVGDRRLPLRGLFQALAGASSGEDASDRLLARFDLNHDEANEILGTSLEELLRKAVVDDAAADDSLAPQRPHGRYVTRAGRLVYGGGGITPDVLVSQPVVAEYVAELQRRGLLFAAVVEHVASDSVRMAALTGEALDEELLRALKAYLQRCPDAPRFEDEPLRALRAVRQSLESVGLLGPLEQVLAQIEARIVAAGSSGDPPERVREQLLHYLRSHAALRLRGRAAELRASLEGDPCVQRAIEVLADREAYRSVLAVAGP